ncbi:hypothetical protein D5S18_10160 [Nocardia panacis]|uniref:WXG100 family type VII secretion target n=1 Tax=Nocardia panacis TaxID=2340916 RepID=A0A3A4KD52_9NOCA|nr:hypothetical protein D5S18_10160 [Nocardia panacis]
MKLKDAFGSVETTEAHNAAAAFQRAQQKWSDGLREFQQRMMSAVAEAWEGQAAEASKRAIVRYTTSADQLSGAFNTLNRLIGDAAQASVDTKKAVDTIADNPRWWNPDAWPFMRSRFENDRNEHISAAQDKMRDAYVARFATADHSVPVLPKPQNLADPADIPLTGGPGPGGSQPPGGTGSHSGQPGPTADGAGTAADGVGKQGDSSGSKGEMPAGSTATNPSQAQSPSDTTKTAPTGTGQTPQSATATQQATSNSPASSGSATPTPGIRSGGSPRTTTGVGPGAPNRTPAPRVATGVPVPPQPQSGKPTMSPVAAQAKPGGAGVPGGMAPGAAQGKGEDGKEHKSPDYLKNMDNTRELLGEEPRTLPDGVLGGDHDR